MAIKRQADESAELGVNGTLMWYYHICIREVWLISHQVTPYEHDENLQLGRYISQHSYDREQKEVSVAGVKLDVLGRRDDGTLIVGEIKKSSRYEDSARMQLLLYLETLEKMGLKAVGELRFPSERRRVRISLDDAARKKLDKAKRDILRIVYLEHAPKPKKLKWCTKCAYREFCWS